jgi:hypothetical protein
MNLLLRVGLVCNVLLQVKLHWCLNMSCACCALLSSECSLITHNDVAVQAASSCCHAAVQPLSNTHPPGKHEPTSFACVDIVNSSQLSRLCCNLCSLLTSPFASAGESCIVSVEVERSYWGELLLGDWGAADGGKQQHTTVQTTQRQQQLARGPAAGAASSAGGLWQHPRPCFQRTMQVTPGGWPRS